MNLLQSFGKFLAMFIDDEEHIERSKKKAISEQQSMRTNDKLEEKFQDDVPLDDFEYSDDFGDEMFEELFD